ncbi:MAG: SDR family NAD(P)-dependent oxidoreductase [Thermoproteales archaeon]|nr:SDR family NAD(P)-dependent oxidoreductase [Thermoproteales archaeon]
MKGLNVLVTGASSGIGKHVSEIMCRKWYTVIGVGRSVERLEELKEKLHPNFHPLVADLSKGESLE